MNKLSSRYKYAENLARVGRHGDSLSRYWPYAPSYEVYFLDLAPYAAGLPNGLTSRLGDLAQAIEREWHISKNQPHACKYLSQANDVADLLRSMAVYLDGDDKDALLARADYVQCGYGDERVQRLAQSEEQISVFAGMLSTWFGKEVRGRPSAFIWARDRTLDETLAALASDRTAISDYLAGLDKRLFLDSPPTFMPGNLLFMAGEANLHPKHIGYFFPEDEGIKFAPHKKTFYFSNSHEAKLRNIAWPLFAEYFPGVGDPLVQGTVLARTLPAAGVLAHELGHFIQRPNTSYTEINKTNRWVSVVLQEVAADVFGTLFLADVWAAKLGASVDQALTYYLADCLGYINRGVGLFPDSDGMLLQLNYFAEFGAIEIVEGDTPRLSYSREPLMAALRSLARVLADTLLAADTQGALALHVDFGPDSPPRLQPLLKSLAARPPRAIEYLQDHVTSPSPPIPRTERQLEASPFA